MKFTTKIPGYQDLTVENASDGTTFIYIGDNFVALSPDQLREFMTNMHSFCHFLNVHLEQLKAEKEYQEFMISRDRAERPYSY